MSRGVKKTNPYMKEFPNYEGCPKSVAGAIAFSFALRLCGDDFDKAKRMVSDEWDALYQAGIVPQKRK